MQIKYWRKSGETDHLCVFHGRRVYGKKSEGCRSECSLRRIPIWRMFHIVPLVWICNPGPLSIRIFNPPGSNVQIAFF